MTDELTDTPEEPQALEPIEWPLRYEHPEHGPVVEYENGALQNARTGHWIRRPNVTPVMLDPAGMATRRYELARERAVRGMDRAAGLPLSQQGSGRGWEMVVEHATGVFLGSQNSRGLAELLGKMGLATGFLAREDTPPLVPVNVSQQNIYMSPEQSAALFRLLDDIEAARHPIDAEAVEVTGQGEI